MGGGGGGVTAHSSIHSLPVAAVYFVCFFLNEFLQVPPGGLGEKTPKIRRKISSSEAAVCPVGGN